ncbi:MULTISPECIES: helix-turn-helix domain-containing protein [unclassified Paenibacillus]|uniref:helix-turn-helix domain-containing protein n=1 Tax=unclassified Paenibacillus TaxID=185978 RepID=UPI00095580AA|nr:MULTISPECIES: helix-turn-helix domain-containing protein [unclassified Paenibacillus]ASS68389.1 helix-turn-helix domain-containing protein [Paenibacillus sp. RUD330]SIR31656.1 NitT/TauT family transport system substrate-binding protein [Paenibacillus sp. RU4X]SIR42969.1 NitT/TauT family transport system substrate-binding protein [Paenibacillus sp. RU4T]
MPNEPFNLMSLQEAMDLLGVSRATIDRWRKDKRLPYLKIGKDVWIDRIQLEQWARGGLRNAAAAEKEAAAGPAVVPPPSPEAPSDEAEITVGYQSGAALLWSALIVKSRGWFEQELQQAEPRRRYRVSWKHADSGMELVEELIAGRVQIASVGDYPIAASLELGRLLPRFQPAMLAFDGKCAGGAGIALVARKEEGIRYGDQLASSAAVSTVIRSSASRRLQAVLDRGRKEAMPMLGSRRMADCLAALLEGRVGAAMLWEPYLTWAQTLGAGMTVAADDCGGDYLTGIMADEAWARAHESVTVSYLKAHIRAHELIRRDSLAAASIIRDASGIPLEVILPVLGTIRWDASVYSRDLLTLSRLGEDDSGPRLRSSSLSAGPAFQASYLQEAAAALKLPSLPDMAIPHDWTDDRFY